MEPFELPVEHDEIAELIEPQFEFIVALSGMERVFDGRQNRDYVDTHHLFWPRSQYRTPLEKTFRRQFIIPINRGVHEELHATVPPPHKPDREHMLGYLMLLDKKEKGR